jgi:hypothetical protein
MEHHEARRKLSFVQHHAYYKAFLHALDEADVEVSNWEAEFIGSNLEHVGCFTPKQEEVINRLMDKYKFVKPKPELYSDDKKAHRFIYPVSDDNRK